MSGIKKVSLRELVSRFYWMKWIVLKSGNILFSDAHEGPILFAPADMSIEMNDWAGTGEKTAYEQSDMYREFFEHFQEIDFSDPKDIFDLLDNHGDLGERYVTDLMRICADYWSTKR